jgi:hypothetical protein
MGISDFFAHNRRINHFAKAADELDVASFLGWLRRSRPIQADA